MTITQKRSVNQREREKFIRRIVGVYRFVCGEIQCEFMYVNKISIVSHSLTKIIINSRKKKPNNKICLQQFMRVQNESIETHWILKWMCTVRFMCFVYFANCLLPVSFNLCLEPLYVAQQCVYYMFFSFLLWNVDMCHVIQSRCVPVLVLCVRSKQTEMHFVHTKAGQVFVSCLLCV